MKVKELKKILSKMDPNAEVLLSVWVDRKSELMNKDISGYENISIDETCDIKEENIHNPSSGRMDKVAVIIPTKQVY